MRVEIACIVEGDGEVETVPLMIRRVAEKVDPALALKIRPMKFKKNKLLKPRELERAVELAALRTQGRGGVLVILDSDDDCPAEIGPKLLGRARRARSDVPLSVVVAKHEFENWFLAAAESLRGKRGLPNDLTSPADPESIRGAKEWLGAHMDPGRSYSPVLDQPALAFHLDLQAARQAKSFDKCYREVVRLLEELKAVLRG